MWTAGGCVSREKRDVEAAKEALDECRAEYGEDHPACKPLVDRLTTSQGIYEKKARDAWGCDPAQEECPTRR